MSYSEFVRLCEKVECLSSRVTHQLVNTYPELHKFRRELNSFQDELVGIIRELPSEEEEEVSREQRRLLNFDVKPIIILYDDTKVFGRHHVAPKINNRSHRPGVNHLGRQLTIKQSTTTSSAQFYTKTR